MMVVRLFFHNKIQIHKCQGNATLSTLIFSAMRQPAHSNYDLHYKGVMLIAEEENQTTFNKLLYLALTLLAKGARLIHG